MADEPKNSKNPKDSKVIEDTEGIKKTKEIKEKKAEEVKTEAKAPAKLDLPESPKLPKSPKFSKAKLSKKLEDLIGQIEKLSVLELADLVKALEEKFGVSGMPVIAPATAPAAGTTTGAAAGGAPEASEQTTFNVILASPGANKISVIKMVREINQTLGLKEAKDLVESAPKEILSGVNKSTAEEAKKKLEGVGASVELK